MSFRINDYEIKLQIKVFLKSMGSKYQFREQGRENSFENKNVFINHCQHKYQKSLHYSNPTWYYSYNFGETWNHISNFKSDRQTIQNEKKPQNENRNHSSKSESKLDQSSGVPTWVLIILTPIILFGVYYYANQNNQNKVPRTENNTETIKPEDNSSNENNTESSYTNSSESSSNIIDKFIGTWECWDGKYRFRIKILRDNQTKEEFKNGSPQSKLDYVKVEVSDGHKYTFFYNTQQDKLESFWDATKGDIIIDENSGNLLLENNEFRKVE